jgi:hypothetical protein
LDARELPNITRSAGFGFNYPIPKLPNYSIRLGVPPSPSQNLKDLAKTFQSMIVWHSRPRVKFHDIPYKALS